MVRRFGGHLRPWICKFDQLRIGVLNHYLWARRWALGESLATKYTPQAQLSGVAFSTLLALGYSYATMNTFVPDHQMPPSSFWIAVGLLMAITLVAATPVSDFIRPLIPDSFSGSFGRAAYLTLYASTILSVVLLGWICLYTGGPIASPYAVILMAVALLAPYVTDALRSAISVALLVIITYLAFWWLFERSPRELSADAPAWVYAVTSIASVLISLLMEMVRDRTDRRTQPSVAAEDAAP